MCLSTLCKNEMTGVCLDDAPPASPGVLKLTAGADLFQDKLEESPDVITGFSLPDG